ncbi:MAG TPA: DoxX family protein [Magnetospirillum sp.]|jgi:putative oxidoreductase|nr:DoxX family protein [Magnetospirillum sp.]
MQSMASSLKTNFDISNGMNVIRMMAGAFYAPHIIYKIVGWDASLVFFSKAGLEPALLFLTLSLITESVCAVGLFFGILTRWVGLAAAATMVVATYATFNVKGVGWLWNKGGVEYLAFWGVVSLVLAWMAWQAHWAKR